MFQEARLFQKCALGIFIIFMGIMLFVTVFAQMRTSGSTRQDMSEAQFIRRDSLKTVAEKNLLEEAGL